MKRLNRWTGWAATARLSKVEYLPYGPNFPVRLAVAGAVQLPPRRLARWRRWLSWFVTRGDK